MKLYHWTINRKSIEKNGFHDGDHGCDAHGRQGFWFADRILGTLEGIKPGTDLLTLGIPEDIVDPYEWKQEGSGYREWCIPADIINKYDIKFTHTYVDRGIYKVNEKE